MNPFDQYDLHAANINSTDKEELQAALEYFENLKQELPDNISNSLVSNDHEYYGNLIQELKGKL